MNDLAENTEIVEENPAGEGEISPENTEIGGAEPQGEEQEKKQEKKQGAQDRIRELNTNWRKEQEDNAFLRGQNQVLMKMQQPVPKVDVTPPKELKLEDFDHDHEAYTKAMIDANNKENDKKLVSIQEGHKLDAEAKDLSERCAQYEAYEKDNPGFMARVEDTHGFACNQNMLDDARGKYLPHILDYLSLNTSEAARISKLSPREAAVEIGMIKANLNNKPKPKLKTGSEAPDPVPIISGGGGGNATVDESKMTYQEKKERFDKKEREKLGIKT